MEEGESLSANHPPSAVYASVGIKSPASVSLGPHVELDQSTSSVDLLVSVPPLASLKLITFLLQNPEGNDTCGSRPTLVSKPYYRVDLFNRQMRDVLFTAVLVTTTGNHTLGHFGTSDGRILQVS